MSTSQKDFSVFIPGSADLSPETLEEFVLHNESKYVEACQDEISARSKLISDVERLEKLNNRIEWVRSKVKNLTAEKDSLLESAWKAQLVHHSEVSIASGLVDSFYADNMLVFIDMGLVVQAAETSQTPSQAIKKIILGHFTEDAIMNTTVVGCDGLMSLFPALVQTLISTLQQEDLCLRFGPEKCSRHAMITAIRSLKSNLRRKLIGKSGKNKRRK